PFPYTTLFRSEVRVDLHPEARCVERDRRVRLWVERVGAHPRLDAVRRTVAVTVEVCRDDARLPPAGAVDERAEGRVSEGDLEVRAEACVDTAQALRSEHPGLPERVDGDAARQGGIEETELGRRRVGPVDVRRRTAQPEDPGRRQRGPGDVR